MSSPWNLVDPLVGEAEARAASNEVLSLTIAVLVEEQARRAREDDDADAVAEAAFVEAFDFQGKPTVPYLSGNLLVCPGGKLEKSATSHDCVFVAVGDVWVWEHDDILFDDMRQVPGKKWRRSVTVIPAVEGLEFDVVSSQSRSSSRCMMKQARSFEIQNGQLVETQVRARKVASHR